MGAGSTPEGAMDPSGTQRTSGTPHGGPSRARRLILVVDDDREVREVVALALELEGYAVERAVDGLDALLALRCGPLPAAIVLDVEMASMAGSDFRAAQLRDPALARIPVLVLSSSARAVDAQLRLAKPADPDVLVRAIRELAGPP
jgi:CheY-like chemotaxis protein